MGCLATTALRYIQVRLYLCKKQDKLFINKSCTKLVTPTYFMPAWRPWIGVELSPLGRRTSTDFPPVQKNSQVTVQKKGLPTQLHCM